MLCFPSAIPSAGNRMTTNWAAWQLEAMKMTFIAATVVARWLSHGEQRPTAPLCFSCGVLTPRAGLWPLVLLGTLLTLALTADGRAGMKYKSTAQTADERQQKERFMLFSAAHHKGAAKNAELSGSCDSCVCCRDDLKMTDKDLKWELVRHQTSLLLPERILETVNLVLFVLCVRAALGFQRRPVRDK